MKKIIIILIAAIGITFTSCKKLEDYNVDPKNATSVPAATLFSNGLKNLVDQVSTPSVNKNIFRLFAQYWTETTYPDESNYDLTSRQIPDYEFRTIYRDVLANLNEAEKVIATETSVQSTDAEKKNKTAATEILMVYAFQREVDIFGNVPYSEAFDVSNISPKYDDAQTIYSSLFTRLDAAIAEIDVNANGFTDGDLLYFGDMSKWKAFGNSLKLKMAVTVADIPALNPGAHAADAVTGPNGGVFTSSADNATFTYLGAQPNASQIWVELVSSGRHDFVPANTLVDTMNALNDPRRPLYFEQNLGDSIYEGGIYGDNNTYKLYSHITATIQTPEWPGLLMSYSEVQFYLAEAAARSWAVGGSADMFYMNGITASIVDDWGGDPADAAAYLLTVPLPTVYEDELKAIALQSWIASYDRGLIGWTTWRRLDAPVFHNPAITGNEIPNRYTYPIVEQTLNGSNYNQAAAAMGGDTQQSKIFWDVH
jgi:hypothetical protein